MKPEEIGGCVGTGLAQALGTIVFALLMAGVFTVIGWVTNQAASFVARMVLLF